MRPYGQVAAEAVQVFHAKASIFYDQVTGSGNPVRATAIPEHSGHAILLFFLSLREDILILFTIWERFLLLSQLFLLALSGS